MERAGWNGSAPATCSSVNAGSVVGNGDVLGSANPQVYAAPYFHHPYSSRE